MEANEITKRLIGSPGDAIPEEISDFVQTILEGRAKQFGIVVESESGSVSTYRHTYDDGNNLFVMLGALDVFREDLLAQIRLPPDFEE